MSFSSCAVFFDGVGDVDGAIAEVLAIHGGDGCIGGFETVEAGVGRRLEEGIEESEKRERKGGGGGGGGER